MTDMTYDDLKQAGINVEEGLSYTGDSEKYLAALQRFYRRADKTKAAIRDYLSGSMCEELTILVHALKTNARTIGANPLGELAERMETLGKEGNDEALLSLVLYG
jgi:HPt (histidine-containing phosphotransfer) domain-containing protein